MAIGNQWSKWAISKTTNMKFSFKFKMCIMSTRFPVFGKTLMRFWFCQHFTTTKTVLLLGWSSPEYVYLAAEITFLWNIVYPYVFLQFDKFLNFFLTSEKIKCIRILQICSCFILFSCNSLSNTCIIIICILKCMQLWLARCLLYISRYTSQKKKTQ